MATEHRRVIRPWEEQQMTEIDALLRDRRLDLVAKVMAKRLETEAGQEESRAKLYKQEDPRGISAQRIAEYMRDIATQIGDIGKSYEKKISHIDSKVWSDLEQT